MSNVYIDFYGKHNISPVHQDITDFALHLRRRQKLYRLLGIPTFAFRNVGMLEVGPGGGHNALAPLAWGVGHLDLVEPNAVGVETMRQLFDERDIPTSQYTIHQQSAEEFAPDKEYDIIVAEGFLGYVSNASEICRMLAGYLRNGG